MGLNYTTFSLATTPSPNHLASAPSSNPKTIAIASPFLSFNLYSVSLSCIAAPPPTGDCTILMVGNGVHGSGTLRAADLTGTTMQTFPFEGTHEWVDMSQVTFTAQNGGAHVGVAIWAMEYAVVGSC